MASETATTQHRATNGSAGRPTRTDVQAAAHEVRGALESVGRQVPEVARASRQSLWDAFRAIEAGSDERVNAGVTLSLGLAIGMLLGGAPRLLVLAALVPVAAMGLVIEDRRTRGTKVRAAA
jgi:hypothetical protein